jgi:AcrR family transcriptional regulator
MEIRFMQSRWVLIRQARRMRLLRGAGQIFAQIGFERSSMNVIAEVCGVTKATVYAHFGSKAGY